MALFLASYVNKLDKKGRVSVPAAFRTHLVTPDFQGVVIFPSYKYPCLEACTMARMEDLSQSVDHLALFSDEADDLSSVIFADAKALPFDAEGRIHLPEDFLTHAAIHDAVTFVGRGPTFQLWQPAHFAQHQKEARQKALKAKRVLPLRLDKTLPKDAS